MAVAVQAKQLADALAATLTWWLGDKSPYVKFNEEIRRAFEHSHKKSFSNRLWTATEDQCLVEHIEALKYETQGFPPERRRAVKAYCDRIRVRCAYGRLLDLVEAALTACIDEPTQQVRLWLTSQRRALAPLNATLPTRRELEQLFPRFITLEPRPT